MSRSAQVTLVLYILSPSLSGSGLSLNWPPPLVTSPHPNVTVVMEEITSADKVTKVIHGTNFKAWNEIQKTGLSRMKRNHIHFAVGEPGSEGVISGMRACAQVYIYIDLHKAMENGVEFFRSANNVILSPGDESHPAEIFQTSQERQDKSAVELLIF